MTLGQALSINPIVVLLLKRFINGSDLTICKLFGLRWKLQKHNIILSIWKGI